MGEAILKLIALDYRYFYTTEHYGRHYNRWNIFDFTIVMGTCIGILLKAITGTNIGSVATVVRTFRVGRIFRLAKTAKSLRTLFNTLLVTLPGLWNIGLLLLLLYLIYAIMAVQLFAKVQFQEDLNEHANFQTFSTAMLTLIRASTGENWNGIMYDLARRPEGCVDDPDFNANMCGFNNFEGCIPINGCGTDIASLIFVTFTLFVTFVT